MKIPVDSVSAERLRQHGVTNRELNHARIFVFNQQLGSAITLPLPVIGPVILIRRGWLVFDDDDHLADGPSLKVLRHELCHVRQILDWGGSAYIRRHILARIRTRSFYAKRAPEESTCYLAEAKVAGHYAALDQPGNN